MKRLILLLIAATSLSINALAVDPSHFTINRISAPYFIVDGNSPATVTRCYIGFEVINNSNSGVTYDRLVLSIPTTSSSVSGTAFNILAPGSRSVNIGTLAPGRSKVCYFFVEYPANTSAVGTFNVELNDETPVRKYQSFNIANRSSISANAGGSSTNSFNNQNILGGILTDTVTYRIGNVRSGDETDFQIAATTAFDPTKLDLIGTRVIQSNVPGIPVGTTDSLYFISGNGGVGSTIRIIWIFRIVAYDFTTYLLPLAGATSGSTNYKYTLNSTLGTGSPVSVSTNANPLIIKKYSDADVYCPADNPTATFIVEITNPSIYNVSIQKITDTLPSGFSFVSMESGSGVNILNAVNYPEPGDTGSLVFEGGVSSFIGTSFVVPAGGFLKLIYIASVPDVSNTELVSGASAFVGATPIGFTKDTVTISCLLPVTLSQFTAFRQNNNAMLRWITEKEFNSSAFIIEHSTDGASWSRIGTVEAAGQSDVRRIYNLIHRYPANGMNYYRLRELSTTGTFSLSQIARLMFGENVPTTKVYPNPVRGGMMNVETDKGRNILILDSKGRLVLRQNTLPGSNRINVGHLSKGLYILKTETDTQKIIIE
jgi:hypothetical protein